MPAVPPVSDPAAICAESRKVIARHAALVAGATFVPFPLVDSVSVTAVQLEMIRTLARLHGRSGHDRELSAVLASLGGGVMSYFIGRSGPALAFKAAALAVPVVGPLVRYGTGPALMAGYTWVLGEAFRRHFAAGGTVEDFTVARFREVAREIGPAGVFA
jgi:uncharacterized protein (DUF697 family)